MLNLERFLGPPTLTHAQLKVSATERDQPPGLSQGFSKAGGPLLSLREIKPWKPFQGLAKSSAGLTAPTRLRRQRRRRRHGRRPEQRGGPAAGAQEAGRAHGRSLPLIWPSEWNEI